MACCARPLSIGAGNKMDVVVMVGAIGVVSGDLSGAISAQLIPLIKLIEIIRVLSLSIFIETESRTYIIKGQF